MFNRIKLLISGLYSERRSLSEMNAYRCKYYNMCVKITQFGIWRKMFTGYNHDETVLIVYLKLSLFILTDETCINAF